MYLNIYFPAILLRVLATYIFLQALSILPMGVMVGSVNPVLFLFSHEFTSFIISLILWFSAKPIAKLMTRDLSQHFPDNDLPNDFSHELEPLIFSCIGLVLIVTAIPQLVNMVVYHSAVSNITNDPTLTTEAIASTKAFTARFIAKIIIGLLLVLFSNKCWIIIAKMRNKFNK